VKRNWQFLHQLATILGSAFLHLQRTTFSTLSGAGGLSVRIVSNSLSFGCQPNCSAVGQGRRYADCSRSQLADGIAKHGKQLHALLVEVSVDVADFWKLQVTC